MKEVSGAVSDMVEDRAQDVGISNYLIVKKRLNFDLCTVYAIGDVSTFNLTNIVKTTV